MSRGAPVLPESHDQWSGEIVDRIETIIRWKNGMAFELDDATAEAVTFPEAGGAGVSEWYTTNSYRFQGLTWTRAQALAYVQAERSADPVAAWERDTAAALDHLETARFWRERAWRVLHDPTDPRYQPLPTDGSEPLMFSRAYNAQQDLAHADRFEREALQRLAELKDRGPRHAQALTLF